MTLKSGTIGNPNVGMSTNLRPTAPSYAGRTRSDGGLSAITRLADTRRKTMAIIKCNCKHDFQDERYGKSNRVHNYAVAVNSKNGGWRCTVCAAIKPASAAPKE